MGYNELIEIDDELQNKPDLQSLSTKRQPVLERLFNDFIGSYEDRKGIVLTIRENSIPKLSLAYFTFCYTYIKPAVEDKINRFKMASVMELLVVMEQVLVHPDEDESLDRQVNAEFGITAALSLINCMIANAKKEFCFDCHNVSINEKATEILDNHIYWLMAKDLNELPIIINAQFFELLELLHRAPIQLNAF
jgi:hypothetical protein